jgi:hypothetical protein
MQTLDSNMANDSTSLLTGEIKNYLLETAKWGKFLAIVGYVGIGLMLVIAISIMAVGSSTSQLFPGMMGMNMGFFGLIYIVIAAFYFFPVYYLHQFSLKIAAGLSGQNSQNITVGFQNLKSLFKFMGIFTIVILSLYGLVIIVAIVAGGLM